MIFFEHKLINSDEKTIQFSASEDGCILGSCVLVLKQDVAEVTSVEFNENKKYVVEGLIKSAFNFAANRNYYMGRCSAVNIDFCLDRMNIIKCDGYYENDIPSILMGSCSGCCK